MSLPPLILKKNEDRRLRAGHLWVFSNEVDIVRMPLKDFAPGDLVEIQAHNGRFIGSGHVNPNSLIAARILSRDEKHLPDHSLLVHRLNIALSLRERPYPKPFYRLVFGESDGLPGLVVDRYGDVLVAQITTAGMERMKPDIVAALTKVLKPAGILFRNDVSIRELEGLPLYTEVAHGSVPETVTLEEHGQKFEVALKGGLKTGWFFDRTIIVAAYRAMFPVSACRTYSAMWAPGGFRRRRTAHAKCGVWTVQPPPWLRPSAMQRSMTSTYTFTKRTPSMHSSHCTRPAKSSTW